MGIANLLGVCFPIPSSRFVLLTLRCVRKSCRCVRCLSRYGHLGARTTNRRYETASTSEIFASPRLSWNSSLPLSTTYSGMESATRESSYNTSWNAVHNVAPQQNTSSRPRSPPRGGLKPYDIAIPESECYFLEHLEVSDAQNFRCMWLIFWPVIRYM